MFIIYLFYKNNNQFNRLNYILTRCVIIIKSNNQI